MELESRIAEILDWILSGVKVNEMVGDWHISNVNNSFLVDFMYKQDAIYGFQFILGDRITLFNYHREARTGAGSLTLRQLEAAFHLLAKRKGKPIEVVFDPANQRDTKVWLQKNGYLIEQSGHYKKILEP